MSLAWTAGITAAAGALVTGVGAWKVWHLDPDETRYAMPSGAARLKAKPRPGFHNYMRDTKAALAWVVIGAWLQFVAVAISLIDRARSL